MPAAAAPLTVHEALDQIAKGNAKPAPVTPERREKPRVNARDGTRVLVIDDSPTIVALLKRMLEQSGYIALEAVDAETGVALALKEEPDLIFLDIVLPGMNGFEALRRLRREPVSKTIPIIMISGNELATEQFYAQRIGADDFMKKPFARSEVFARIEKLLTEDKVLRRHVPGGVAVAAAAAAATAAATAATAAPAPAIATPVAAPATIAEPDVAPTLVTLPATQPIAAPESTTHAPATGALAAAASAEPATVSPEPDPAIAILAPETAAADATATPVAAIASVEPIAAQVVAGPAIADAPAAADATSALPSAPPPAQPAVTIVMPGAAPAPTIAAMPASPASPAAVMVPPVAHSHTTH